MMSIALHSNNGGIESSGGFGCGGDGMDARKLRDMTMRESIFVKEDVMTDSCPSSSSFSSFSTSLSSSSIGKNSDDDDECGDVEVQSSFKGALDMMDALEEALPIRRGISGFYNGKSKSFTSLADASAASSIKDITKAANAYTRKRRNLLAVNQVLHNTRRRSSGGGISKRSVSLSRSALALAVAMSSSEKSGDASTDSWNSTPRSPLSLPPLYPQVRAANRVASSTRLHNWKSFSVADFQQCASPTARNMS